MKNYLSYRLWVLPILIFFQFCVPTKYYQDDIQYFTEIPLKDQNQDRVKVYFPDDLTPERRPYIEAGLVRLAVKGHFKTKQLVEQLRLKAQSLGLDAVIETRRLEEGSRGASLGEALALGAVDGAVNGVLGLQDESSSDGYETYSHSVLEGIGIKYLDNIHNIDKSVKSEKAYLSTQLNELLYDKRFFLNGETKSLDFDQDSAIYIHNNIIEAFSLHHLINQKANWKYHLHFDKLYRRDYHKTNDWIVKSCKFIYDGNPPNSMKKIVVRYPGEERKEVIKLYRKWNSVEKKEIFTNGKLSYTEKLIYDNKNRLLTRNIFQIEDRVEKLWLIVKYDYYQNNELKNYLGKKDSQ